VSSISNIPSLDEGSFSGKRVLLRPDINSPIDRDTGNIVNDNRIQKSLPTIRDLSEQGARVVIIAHQGDTTDYTSLISLAEHAERLSEALGKPVQFIEDIAGPAAIEKIRQLEDGEILLLDNIRYLTEEVSTFEDSVTQTPTEMARCYMVRQLAPEFDCYVNDAFAAAHRNAPSMVGFQELMPSYAGRLLIKELSALEVITNDPARPCIFMLGGSRAGDAFGMIEQVLKNDSADQLLLSGLIGQIFMLADGINIGEASEGFIRSKGFGNYIDQAQDYLANYRSKLSYPVDIAIESDGLRRNIEIADLTDEMVISPAGIYERAIFEKGTRALWNAVADSDGFSVVGGGDSVTSFTKYVDMTKLNYVSTAGGALIRYLSGVKLPLIDAMQKSTAK